MVTDTAPWSSREVFKILKEKGAWILAVARGLRTFRGHLLRTWFIVRWKVRPGNVGQACSQGDFSLLWINPILQHIATLDIHSFFLNIAWLRLCEPLTVMFIFSSSPVVCELCVTENLSFSKQGRCCPEFCLRELGSQSPRCVEALLTLCSS